MTTNALAELQFSDKARKRAQWESFEFSVPVEGTVAVAINAPVLEAASAEKKEKKRAIADGGQVLEAKPGGSEAENGCPHGHPDCEGADAPGRPVLCWDCWEVWAR